MDVRFTSPTTLADALTAAAAGHRPVAGGTDLVVGTRQGKWSLPENLVALDRIAELRGIARTARRPPDRCDDQPRRAGRSSGHPRTLDGHRRRGLDRRLAGHAPRRDARRQHRQRVAGRRDERAAALFRRRGRAPLDRGRPSDRSRRPVQRSRPDDASHPDELIVAVVPARARRRRQLLRPAGIPATDGDRGRRRDRRRAPRWRRRPDARIAITALAPTVRRVAVAESALIGTDGGPAAAAEAGRLAAEAATPISDVRSSLEYRRAMAAVVVRRAVTAAIARARGETVPIPASASTFGAR